MASGKPEGGGPRIPYELGADEYDTDPGYRTPGDEPPVAVGEPEDREQAWFGTKDMWDKELTSDRDAFDCSPGTKWRLNTGEDIERYRNISSKGKNIYLACKSIKVAGGGRGGEVDMHQGSARWWCKEKGMIASILSRSGGGEDKTTYNVGDIVWAFNEFIKAGIMIGSTAETDAGPLFDDPAGDALERAPRVDPDVAPEQGWDSDPDSLDWYSRVKRQGMVAEVLGMLGAAGIPVHEIDISKPNTRKTLSNAPRKGEGAGELSPTDARNKEYPVSEPAAKLRAEPGPKHTQLGLDV